MRKSFESIGFVLILAILIAGVVASGCINSNHTATGNTGTPTKSTSKKKPSWYVPEDGYIDAGQTADNKIQIDIYSTKDLPKFGVKKGDHLGTIIIEFYGNSTHRCQEINSKEAEERWGSNYNLSYLAGTLGYRWYYICKASPYFNAKAFFIPDHKFSNEIKSLGVGLWLVNITVLNATKIAVVDAPKNLLGDYLKGALIEADELRAEKEAGQLKGQISLGFLLENSTGFEYSVKNIPRDFCIDWDNGYNINTTLEHKYLYVLKDFKARVMFKVTILFKDDVTTIAYQKRYLFFGEPAKFEILPVPKYEKFPWSELKFIR